MKTRSLFIALTIFSVLLSFRVYGICNLRGWFVDPTKNAQQMVLVIGNNWQATTGNLYRYERDSINDKWKKIGKEILVNLGENGMGWGIGLHGSTLTLSPRVIEGTHKTPVGVFAITSAFGEDNAKKSKVKLPYQPITTTLFCPDDKNSKFYNRLVDTKNVTKDWQSAEDMYAYMKQGLYAHGFIVNHNYDNPISGRGSCFFVHVYRAPGIPTLGCTAFAPDLVREIVIWLDPARKPVLVQLPKNMYTLFKNRWHLPKV